MINSGNLRFNGKLNYQNGLLFYFSNQGHVVSFLISTIGNRKRKVKVTMHSDVNHERAHVHINDHGASIAIDTCEVLAGDCDNRTRRTIGDWINKNREDLLDLWEIVKSGQSYRPVLERIRSNRSFDEYGFSGEEPRRKTVVGNVTVWHNKDIIQKRNANGTQTVISDGDLFIGIPANFQEGNIIFESMNGIVHRRRLNI